MDISRIPTAVSPNGDGVNEAFELPEPLRGSSLKVYNRWGIRVFADPSYQNTWVPNLTDHTYFILLENECFDAPYKGFLEVITAR